jgi:hypothetical protein
MKCRPARSACAKFIALRRNAPLRIRPSAVISVGGSHENRQWSSRRRRRTVACSSRARRSPTEGRCGGPPAPSRAAPPAPDSPEFHAFLALVALTGPSQDVSHPVPSRGPSRAGWGPGRPRILKTGGRREEDLSAQPQEPQANARISQAHEHPLGPERAAPPAPQGPQAAHGQRLEEVVR